MPFDKVCTNSLGELVDPLTHAVAENRGEIDGKKWPPDF